jgi:hypothetical protein
MTRALWLYFQRKRAAALASQRPWLARSRGAAAEHRIPSPAEWGVAEASSASVPGPDACPEGHRFEQTYGHNAEVANTLADLALALERAELAFRETLPCHECLDVAAQELLRCRPTAGSEALLDAWQDVVRATLILHATAQAAAIRSGAGAGSGPVWDQAMAWAYPLARQFRQNAADVVQQEIEAMGKDQAK